MIGTCGLAAAEPARDDAATDDEDQDTPEQHHQIPGVSVVIGVLVRHSLCITFAKYFFLRGCLS